MLFTLMGLLGGSFGLDGPQRWAAGTVLLMTVWWICEPVSLWLTACLPLLLFPVLKVAPIGGVALQYVDPVNFLFLGGMLIAAAMQQWGLHRRIALEIISFIGTGPRQIVLGFMLGTGFISLWISNTAAAMMMYPIGLAVLLKLREQPDLDERLHARFGLALMLGIAYAASIGGIGTKIGTAPNLVFVKLADPVIGHDIDFLMWLKMGLPVVVIALPLVWFYLVRFAAPLPAQGFVGSEQVIRDSRAQMGPMHRGEKIALVAFLTAALLWIFRKDIELDVLTIHGWWGLVSWGWADVIGRPLDTLPAPLAKLLSQDVGDAAVAMIVGCALLFIPVSVSPWRPALSLRRAGTVPWGLLVLLGGGFAMAYGIQSSGLSSWIGSWLQGIGDMPPLVTLIVVCLVTVILTEVASNVATANIILPLIAASSSQLGSWTGPLMMAATCAASFGFMLPAGTPPNAIVYSSGYITVPQMARSGLLIDLVGALLVALMGWLLAPWALGLI
jgi:solute carrier family 13 (sodium-dependent dicarboxylate transporter), member 2/3/5